MFIIPAKYISAYIFIGEIRNPGGGHASISF